MKPKSMLLAVALGGLCTLGAIRGWGTEPEPGLLGWWRLDEGAGTWSANEVDAAAEAQLHNVSWVSGPFGKALRFTGSDSYVTLPSLPELDGARAMSLAVWVYWEGTGQYPNILTGGTWSPGGFLIFVNNQTCTFRMGRPGHQHGVAGQAWTETSAPLLAELPMKRWVHLAAVFQQPQIITYVDGQRVGSATWDYPVGHSGPMHLGRWAGAASHQGLIDDVRIYGRALNDDQVRMLADPSGRESSAYQDLGPARDEAHELARFQTRWSTLTVGDNGMLLSLQEKGTGRELLEAPHPLLAVEQSSGRRLQARRMRYEDGLLIADFPHGGGSAAIRIEAEEHYFTATAAALDVPDARRFIFFQLDPSPNKYLGPRAGLASDDLSGVCLRSLGIQVDTSFHGSAPRFRAWTTAEHGLLGHRIGLVAGPRECLIPALRAMARNEDVPKSRAGGPWAMGAEENRGSYLFADLAAKDTDAWIDLARRGGFTNIHLHGWWETLGHYEPRKAYFPGGLDQLKATAARIRAAGLEPGIHTLTACISTDDPWVTPVPSPHLIAANRYTLAEPLSADATTIYVDQRPGPGHDVVWSYSGNGNALRIGNELVRYAAISYDPPYAFLQCERGAFGTEPAGHAIGVDVDYLQQRYLAFYPDPDSPLADQLADRIAQVYNECGMAMIYFDGSEGMRSRYGIDAMRWAIFQRLQGGVTEASEWGHNNWWFHSRLGAWDHPVWAMKQFHDQHIEQASRFRSSDLLEPQLGWWAPRGPSEIARGHFPDELEYFAVKNLSIDGPMSIQGVSVAARPWNARLEEKFTILGWYERLRLARYFDDATVQALGQPGEDFRLRLDDDGRWQFTPTHMIKHRISAMGNGSEQWTIDHPHAAQPLRARLEALYGVAPYDDPQATVLADFRDLDAWNHRSSAQGVDSQIHLETDDVRAGDHSLRFRATNHNQTPRGAWAQFGTVYQHPYFSMLPGQAMGLWVKGDGSGALLNVQIRTPREYLGGISDHYIDLDFTGWRYVELLLRERDSERLTDYEWPYSAAPGSHAVYRNAIDRRHVSQINLLVNEIPAQGQVDILVSPIRSLPVRPIELFHPTLVIGGSTITFPVILRSGHYIELESMDDCALYDERGELIRRFRPVADAVPMLVAGTNRLRFDCQPPEGSRARAEVTVISLGQPFGQPRSDSQIQWRRLNRQYDLPRIITRIDGEDNAWTIVRRAQSAGVDLAPNVEIEIAVVQIDPPTDAAEGEAAEAFLDQPTLTLGDRAITFPVRLLQGHRLICHDQTTWQVLDGQGTPVATGRLPDALPNLAPGTNPITLDFHQQAASQIRVIVKTTQVYSQPAP